MDEQYRLKALQWALGTQQMPNLLYAILSAKTTRFLVGSSVSTSLILRPEPQLLILSSQHSFVPIISLMHIPGITVLLSLNSNFLAVFLIFYTFATSDIDASYTFIDNSILIVAS